MKFSVITPTHCPQWLPNCLRSLQLQSVTDWEWLVVPNGDAGELSLPADPRIRVLPYTGPPDTTIGALKAFAADRAVGEALVELDHDDWLHHACLGELADAFALGADFVYSDFVGVYDSGSCRLYDPAHGWQTYPLEYAGQRYTATRAFDPDPLSLSQVYYAPNHVRAWRRAAYQQLGGHDPTLPICDDFDLVCRTYLAKLRVHVVHRPLYFYREHANTYLGRLDEIQRVSQELSNKYHYQLVDEWCRRRNLLRINCGRQPYDGYLPTPVGELAQHEQVGVIMLRDVLQRLPYAEAAAAIRQAYTALVPGGWLQLSVPSTQGPAAFAQPFTQSYWNAASWRYYTTPDGVAELAALADWPPDCLAYHAARVWDAPGPDGLHSYAELVALKPGYRAAGAYAWAKDCEFLRH